MSSFNFYNSRLPSYYHGMYQDGYTPEEILEASRRHIYEMVEANNKKNEKAKAEKEMKIEIEKQVDKAVNKAVEDAIKEIFKDFKITIK